MKNGLKPKAAVSPQEKPEIYSAKKSGCGCKGTLNASLPFTAGAAVLLPAAALLLIKRRKKKQN